MAHDSARVASTDHPVMAHIIPDPALQSVLHVLQRVRRFLEAGAVETMTERLDQLAELGTTIVTFSGGEPLLHPELDRLIAHVRSAA